MASACGQIAAVAQAMLDRSIEPLAGCRDICQVRHQLSDVDANSSCLLVVVGIESELDDCPLGPARDHWAPAALAIKDRQRDEYLQRVQHTLEDACRILASWR
jgi:hypothetical protein